MTDDDVAVWDGLLSSLRVVPGALTDIQIQDEAIWTFTGKPVLYVRLFWRRFRVKPDNRRYPTVRRLRSWGWL